MDTPQLIFYNGAELLEGPCYDKENNLLYFVSIKQNTVFCLDLETTRIKSFSTDGAVGCAMIRDGKLISAEKGGIYSLDLKTDEKQLITHFCTDPKFRYNDGKLDPKGRLFVGTMGDGERQPEKCGLYRVDGDTSVEVVSGTTISNGLGWTKDGKTMYFIDTPSHNVYEFDYDLKTGNLSNKKVALEVNDGSPDGMCVDIDDTVFIAHWGGSKVSHWNLKTGEKLGEISLPVTNVSCCTVGGENMDTLFITTAQSPDIYEPLAGGLFAVKIR